jgi:hypothetical protein
MARTWRSPTSPSRPRLDEARVASCLERLAARERSVLIASFYEEQPPIASERCWDFTPATCA